MIVICPNKNCQHKLRLPRMNKVLRVSCPKCGTAFRYEFPSMIGTPAGHPEEWTRQDTRALLGEFDKALEDEIRAVKTRGGDKISVVLKDGKFIGELAGRRIYQFSLERKIPVADETPAQIEIMGKNYRASIVRFLEFKLQVCITDFDGKQIPFAHLKIDATYVLRKLREALSFLSSGSQMLDLALKAFNRILPRCSVGKPTFTLVDGKGEGPDSAQAKAIEVCLGNEVSFVHGPPGTGKTRTLVNVINDFANNGKKVLVSCHTNIACDNVVEAFIRYRHDKTVENLLKNGEIVRVGTPVLHDERVKGLTMEALYERLSRDLEEEKKRLSDFMNRLAEQNKRYREYRELFSECQKLRERITDCEQNISATQSVAEQYLSEENSLDGFILEKRRLLVVAEKRNPIINFFKGTRPRHIREAIAVWEQEKTEKTRIRLEKEKRLELLTDNLAKLNQSLSRKFWRLPEGIEIGQIEDVLAGTEKKLQETNAKIVDINERISNLNRGVVENAKVIVSTLAKTFTERVLLHEQFDVVAIDEASIAPLPMLFYVCSLAKEKVLIFGDPKQLAPIKVSATIAAERWLGKDIFQEAAATEDSPDDPRIESLNSQYRMHAEIFRIVNDNFYQGKLHDRRPQIDQAYNKHNRLIPKPERRVVIIDTSNANACVSLERTGRKSWSRYNLYHIQILEKILHDLIDGKYVSQREIGVITPYRSQASFAKEVLMESEFKDMDLGTVHTFQGIEKEYVIFDLVEALGWKRIGVLVNDRHPRYTGKDESQNAALRLLTVSFSRPKDKLLIVAHVEHMLSNLPRTSVIRRVIADLVESRAVVDGSELVPYYVPMDEYPDTALLSENELSGKVADFNQRSLYPYLIRDLKGARKEVVFICGYIYARRIQKLMPYLRDLLLRGIRIRIFTKPPYEQRSREQEVEELHDELRKAGIEIYLHYGTHEKIVAIDRHILYDGSANILSLSHGSKETMTRFDSKLRLQKKLSVLVNNHPELKDYLAEGYVVPEDIVDIGPIRFRDALEQVRPKHKDLPRNEEEGKGYYRSMLKKLRTVIGNDKGRPYFAVLFNDTIETLLAEPPVTVEQLLSLPEFRRNRSNIRGYERIVLEILEECRKGVGKCKKA